MENFVVRRSPFSSDRICQYTELSNMGNRETTRNSTTHTVPFNPAKVTVWCGYMTSFIIGPYFFEETGSLGPVTVTGQRYECLLRDYVIPDLQQRGFVDGIIFKQDGALSHIANPVKQLLTEHFGNAEFISCQFPTAWLPRSPDLNPCAVEPSERCCVQCTDSTFT
ncbi:uncharacterized protein TNCV_1113801 [Trichonephila clavipes]|nr:uncharacterized protein TNCV_1113801 [Trichonephila clavipes]